MSRDVLFVREVPAPPQERPDVQCLRAEADRTKTAYECGLDEIFGCTRPPHRQGHSGRACAVCAEARLLRLAWLRAERTWVEARQAEGLIDDSHAVEVSAEQLLEAYRGQPWPAM